MSLDKPEKHWEEVMSNDEWVKSHREMDITTRLLYWAQNEDMIDQYYTQRGKDLLEAEEEILRLRNKCDMQANILRRLTPENHPDTLFISGVLGERDQNNMPEKLLVVPAYGVDFAYIYERTEKTTGPEW